MVYNLYSPYKNCVVFASPKNQANHQEPFVTALLKVEDLCILGWIFAKMIEIFGEFVSMQQMHHLGTLNMFWISSMTCCCSPHLTSMSISAFHLKHLPSNIPDQISCFFWILLVSRYAYKIPRCLKLPLHCTPLNSKTSIYIYNLRYPRFALPWKQQLQRHVELKTSQAPPSLATMKNIDVSSCNPGDVTSDSSCLS